MENVTNVIRIKTNSVLKISPDGDFFRVWVEALRFVHDLTKREMDILAEFLKVRYQLSKVIIDEGTLDRVLMSKETKFNIRKTCGISAKHFQVIMGKFSRKGVIKNNKIHMNLIPTITNEGVGLMIHFIFEDEQLAKHSSDKSSKKA